jgi:hypothetical protein
MKQKKNHKLINYLADHKKIELVSVNKTYVICTLSKKFTPDDVQPLCDAVGLWPIPQRRGSDNYITFLRFPEDGAK